MPTFFFHLREDGDLIEDPEGSDLPDLEAARTEAAMAACDMVAERLKAGGPPYTGEFEVRDEAGRLLATVPFPVPISP
jgi:hypothetical protein